jgi:hypothetical protein
MDFLTTLWLPILLSAVFVFIISTIIHMVLGYHASDFKKLPDEDSARDTLRELDLAPGTYMVPCPQSSAEMRSEEFQTKVKKGPVMHMIVRSSDTKMTKSLIQWFVYCIVIGLFSAYIGVHAVGPEGDYLDVFRFVGCAAFMGYSLALFQDAIWASKGWSATLKSVFDGLVYALVTAGTFGWLWV